MIFEFWSLSTWLMIIFLSVIIIAISFYFSKKSWHLVVLTFLSFTALQIYLLRSDILDNLFGKYIKQEPRYILRIIEFFGPGIIASVVSYHFAIKRFDVLWKNILMLIILIILNFFLGISIFSNTFGP